jgi:hypothetical protein
MASETTTTILLEGKDGEFEVTVIAEVSPRENIAWISYEIIDSEGEVECVEPEYLSSICIKTSAKQIEAAAIYALREQAAADYEAHFDARFED